MARIHIGDEAQRLPNGEFLPSKPIYIEVPDDVNKDDFFPWNDCIEMFWQWYLKDMESQMQAENKNEKSKNA